MAPIVYSLPSCINYSHHALSTLRDFNFPGGDKLIFTICIAYLNIVIPNVFKHITIFSIDALGKGKRRNEFAEWYVEWRAEWHNYAKYDIRGE